MHSLRKCPGVLQTGHWAGQSLPLLEISLLCFCLPPSSQTQVMLKCTCPAWALGWPSEAEISCSLKYLWKAAVEGRKPRNLLFTVHALYSPFRGNSFESCSAVEWSRAGVTSPKQPGLLQLYTAVLRGRIRPRASFRKHFTWAVCVPTAHALPSRFHLHKLPLWGNLRLRSQI